MYRSVIVKEDQLEEELVVPIRLVQYPIRGVSPISRFSDDV
jgi:hypothetical protein